VAGDFVIWACSHEGKCVRGRLAWANWDVRELMTAKERIEKDQSFLMMELIGWPGGLGQGVRRTPEVAGERWEERRDT
jgi:hypothetical protein